VVIVGAGIIGASIGYHLAQRGARVTILEKQRPGAGATEKSFAWINANPSKRPRSYYELNLLGMAGWRRLCAEFGRDLQVQWGGSVRWFPAGVHAERLRRDVAGHEQWGYATHLIEASDITRLLPAIDPGPVAAACFSEQEGTVDPVQALGAYIGHSRQAGAVVEYPCEVTGISRSSSRVRAVQTTRGPIELRKQHRKLWRVSRAGGGTEKQAKCSGGKSAQKSNPRCSAANCSSKESSGLLPQFLFAVIVRNGLVAPSQTRPSSCPPSQVSWG
jgi:glycine/D-amino acid oxidase-like deaminating enzyme